MCPYCGRCPGCGHIARPYPYPWYWERREFNPYAPKFNPLIYKGNVNVGDAVRLARQVIA